MNWVYKILRLFSYPHKFVIINKIIMIRTYLESGAKHEYIKYHSQCEYCGKIRTF